MERERERGAAGVPSAQPGASERASRRRRLRGRLGLALVATLIVLVLLELVLALVLGNLDVAPFMLDPGDGRCVGLEPGGETTYTGTVLRIPATVHAANEHGYRGPARPKQRDAATLRVVALGDSFTFGQGVSDQQALPATLELELQGSRPVEVLNFGIPGLNLGESIEQYRYFARQWQAQVVVLFLFENDLDKPLCDLVNKRGFMWMLRHSRLFRIGVITLAPDALGVPSPRSDPERVERLRDELTELRDAVTQDGARLIVVSLADPLRDAEATRQLAAEIGVVALVFDRERFEAYEIIPNESHWTAATTRSVAAEIAGWMIGELPPAGQ